MSVSTQRLLRSLTDPPTTTAPLILAVADYAAASETIHAGDGGIDNMVTLLIDLVAHPSLPDAAARTLVERIAVRDTTAGRHAAGMYLTRPHEPDTLAALVKGESRVTVLRYAAARATSPDLLRILTGHKDPELACRIARNPNTPEAERLTTALAVDRAEAAGRPIEGACVMVDELPASLVDPFARAATSRRLLEHALEHPAACATLSPQTVSRVAEVVLQPALLALPAGVSASMATLPGIGTLVSMTVALAGVGDEALRRRMRTWWGDRVAEPSLRAQLHLALRGIPARWGNWSWEAAAHAATLDPASAASLAAACSRRLKTKEAWRVMLTLQATFTGTVDQLLTVAANVTQL